MLKLTTMWPPWRKCIRRDFMEPVQYHHMRLAFVWALEKHYNDAPSRPL